MHIRVLGAAAGGGFPQWNCNCRQCHALRHGLIEAESRTQSSIAVSANGSDWALFNASPDIRIQLEAFKGAHPRHAIRDSGIRSILLIDSQIDHTTGLLMLRESNQPLNIYCRDMVAQDLSTGFPVFSMLSHYCRVNHHAVPLDGGSFTMAGIEGLRFHTHCLKSKAPPYSPHRHDPHDGDTIGVLVEDVASGRTLYYAPGLGEIEPHVLSAMQRADCVMVDGTFWREDEMQHAGISNKKAHEMGHLPQSGPGGMLEVLNGIGTKRKILIHINNTNPILDRNSPERAELDQAGIEVASDGLEFEL